MEMRKKTVKNGINLLTAGVGLIILATFFHTDISQVMNMSVAAETRLIYLGLFWGGCAGCIGIIAAAIGVFQNEYRQQHIYLSSSLIMLSVLIILFFLLLLTSFKADESPRFHPGETIVI